MNKNYDVLVVGAGSAGLTAAIGLARAGFAVAVLEAAPFPGAENWSGCVYFCESLAHPDILGPEGVEALAWERQLVERGFFATDGHGLLGLTYRDKEAFRHCYTVLRPIFDHHMALAAQRFGAALLAGTTVESLIRDEGRVIGVCTNRGALYADLVYLAEGDASQLVTREGYERFTDPRQTPKFLQGIKQVLEFPPHVLESRFHMGPLDGVAYEMLLRNGTLRGKQVHLNMGGFVYTNKQSLSVGLVLPADNLQEHFEGDPNLLIEWFENLPALQPWFAEGKRTVFGAKLIRGGGAREIPTLIDEGLAIGGAASAVGVDFPYPNFTGPATLMGLLITQAARQIRAQHGRFSRVNLQRYYLEPLQKHRYWQDVEFLRRWPGYIKKTRAFFDRDIDLTLQSTYLWTRSNQWVLKRWSNWLRLLLRIAGPGVWAELEADSEQLSHALQMDQVFSRPGIWRLLLDGSINTMRDLLRQPRANLPPAGRVRMHYSVAGGSEPGGLPPGNVRRWFNRFAPVLAAAAKLVYSNDAIPLSQKLPQAVQLLVRQVNLLDVLGAGLLGMAASLHSALMIGWERLRRRKRVRSEEAALLQEPDELALHYAAAAQRAGDLTPYLAGAAQEWEARLAPLQYTTVGASHIHLLWPRALPDKNDIINAGLWHVCPAHVYEARISAAGQLQVVVNYENCIKCETCWRTSDLVDWGRDGEQQFVYAVHSPVVSKLLADMNAARQTLPAAPLAEDAWDSPWDDSRHLSAARLLTAQEAAELHYQCAVLEQKLQEFDEALAREPRTIDASRAEFLDMLARYSQHITARMVAIVRQAQQRQPVGSPEAQQLGYWLRLVSAAAVRAEERSRQVWNRKFAWASGDGRHLRYHHLAGLRHFLQHLDTMNPDRLPLVQRTARWLQAELAQRPLAETMQDWRQRLDAVFPASIWRDLEQHRPLNAAQDGLLRELTAAIPLLNQSDLAATLHPPLRKFLLAELGRRDPSLAYRVAHQLWARDLLTRFAPAEAMTAVCQRGEAWFCVADVRGGREALFVPALAAEQILFLGDNGLTLASSDSAAVRVEPLPSLGLCGAGLASVALPGPEAAAATIGADMAEVLPLWEIVCCADLTALAHGMTDLLCRRAIAHATSRVQFPGLFHDEQSRDTIGKFGAIKKMVAEMAAGRYLMETLACNLSPQALDAASVQQARLVKALVAEVLGTSLSSVAYNAGQVFGGTGYSEDDLLSKYYRDAAAWRFLGPDNVQIYGQRGQTILAGWDSVAEPLSCLPDEAELFDQVVQRKALQAELDEIRVHRSRVRRQASEWLATSAANGLPAMNQRAHQSEFCEGLGQQDAYLLAGKALLLRTHARLEQGLPCEIETALLRVWLGAAAAALGEFENTVQRRLQLISLAQPRPVVDPAVGPPLTLYKDFLAAPAEYNSGEFLYTPANPARPQFVPEMIETDPQLNEQNQAIRTALQEQFGGLRDGMVYERYIEKQHRPDAADLDFLRQRGWFRMPIPRELGGVGSSKAEYYLLTTNTHRLSDGAVSLTIQVNSSLGTTPVLHVRDKDLPRAEKELTAFAGDTALQTDISDRLQALLALFGTEAGAAIATAFQTLHTKLQETVFKSTALRVLTHAFGLAWQEAATAGRQYNLNAMQEALKIAQGHWQAACTQAEEYRNEIQRRRRACDLFLRWVASGQISAFALTEPSAGSDTARVATRARLRSVAVEAAAEGVYRFIPFGGKETRFLLDADRLEFRSSETGGVPEPYACYRWSDDAEPARIHFDEYDYETDDPAKRLYFEIAGRKVHFTDVAQLRWRQGQPWYDYWELTGAKMWITNGRMCGILCLYAKTEEGVTGFIVDRHAEGLLVGKDEAKMGQRGSPTNELALQLVRVPRENVIGLEGRGQVNALETLNVGRAGLAMSAMCQMRPIIDWCEAFIAAVPAEPQAVDWRLQRMQEQRFIAESLSYDVIGRFEHKQTRSVRMESAIAKMLVSELLHDLIETAEEIHGLAGQTQRHLVEKRKRDARVLNIYEGTNEIQRFFILKDLVSEVAGRWAQVSAPPLSGYVGPQTLELENLKTGVRERTLAAIDLFGQQLWQNPNLQANCFLLSEAVAWLAAADSTLGRLAWLSRRDATDEQDPLAALLEIGQRAFARCAVEVRRRLHQFDAELLHLRRGFYAPEIRAASLLFQQAGQLAPAEWPASVITDSLSLLVVLETPVPGVPEPAVVDGRLQEPYRIFAEADRSALELALRLRDLNPEEVTIQVVTVGPPSAAQPLHEMLALGIERVRLLVVPDQDAVPADRAAAALAALLRPEAAFDLILGGGRQSIGEEGLLAPLLAAALGIPLAGTAEQLAVRCNSAKQQLLLVSPQGKRQRPLPAAVQMQAVLPLRKFTIADYLRSARRTVEILPWPAAIEAVPLTFVSQAAVHLETTGEEQPDQLLPLEASQLVLETLGLNGSHAGPASSRPRGLMPDIHDVQSPFLSASESLCVLAVLATDEEGQPQAAAAATIGAAQFLAQSFRVPCAVLVLTPATPEAQQQAARAVLEIASCDTLLVPLASDSSEDVRRRFLVEIWAQLQPQVQAVVGEPWTEAALAVLAGPQLATQRFLARILELDRQQGKLSVETSRLSGKVRCQQWLTLTEGETCWLTLSEGAQIGAMTLTGTSDLRLERWQPNMERFYQRDDMRRLLAELQQETGLLRLSDADFIIDVGFGIGNRDGYEEVIMPLEEALRQLGVRNLMIGGSRKVTEELHLLPVDRQIGQSGVSVHPRLLLAIGISGAPQHLNYIDARTTIVAFNRDPEAPLLTLNQRQPQPRVYPVVGDLFETVPAFIAGLQAEYAEPLQTPKIHDVVSRQ